MNLNTEDCPCYLADRTAAGTAADTAEGIGARTAEGNSAAEDIGVAEPDTAVLAAAVAGLARPSCGID